ncbi:MAG: T9SS type A sorting domain-containing protein [Chitinophagaceae bacterium]|nr:T9SS type A sorting domain-containing protein [Chitinophagaceae bacterium]MBL0131721.1 T9SS type A sorting domain-containing protein [Chitinophagaceae bacterium]MBL0272066.1 T9SS type A sorting domain-containing protein [Chitinophagaceae bacterium]
MKLHATSNGLKTILALGISTGLLMAEPAFASRKTVTKLSLNNPGEEKPVKKNKTKTSRSFASLNNSSVKIYPDAVKREMHIIAKENEGQEINFFVFDVEGTLVQNFKMKSKDHNRITGLARGTYLYRVFNGDEETAAGNFEIR